MDPNRQTTAQKRMQTGMRMGTGMRQSTAMQREANFSGVGYNTKVTAIDRPVTNHGMSGIKIQNQGPGRQIYDRNYYLNQLKSKNNEIVGEISKMKQEVEDINKDNTQYLTLERQYELLIKDVRKYEGDLADYNLSLDKYRSDTKPEDIENLYLHIKNQNDKQRTHLDNLFGDKRDLESEIGTYETQIQDINFQNEARLNDLDPEQRNEYEKLKEENNILTQEINNSRNELEEVNTRLVQAETRLRQDTLKQRAQHLKDERTQLMKKKEDLQLQTNEMNLPLPEARERLQNRIKQDNTELKQMDKDLIEMRKMVDQYQQNIKEIDNDLKENNKAGNSGEEQKYEILYQKEKEINEFTLKFNHEKAEYEKEIKDSQSFIASLLEHMQKSMARQNKLPTQAQVEDMRSDLKFKQDQMEDAETTAARLVQQKEQIQNDLEKVKSLETRIHDETKNAKQKCADMEDDMSNKFTKTDQLKTDFEREKQSLMRIKQFVGVYKINLSKQITLHSMKHDTKKNQILRNEIYNRLNDIEKKLIQNESQIYAIQQYIESKGAESNYQNQFQDCMQICSQINLDLIKSCMALA